MKCPICQKEVEIKKKQIGVNDNNEPIFNEYAICRDCKKQWNLDKQRAKKAAKKAAASSSQPSKAPTPKTVPKKTEQKKPNETISPEKTTELKKAPSEKSPVKRTARPVPVKEASEQKAPKQASENRPQRQSVQVQPKKRTAAPATDTPSEQRYANIPPEKIRTKREKAVRKGYEDMLATDPNRRPLKKKRTEIEEPAVRKKTTKSTPPARRKPEPEPSVAEENLYEEETPRFGTVKIVFGILSLLVFAFFTYKAFTTGLSDVTSGNESSAGTTYIILALCLLLSGILLFILRKKNILLAFLFPALFSIGAAVFAFLKRSSDSMLMYCAIGCSVLAVVFIILTILSLGAGERYDEDDYDDPFEDDYDNY
ncbi:hypothetical protein H8S37_06155 [Mediterraneibacter sp. NSJ-55]|uniref:MFS transporter n=1 Tax=Mediterraneibacter hominis TaxID=2763054 RepID=A0A923LGU6_9FIRM|nr:hypothetical protein [Mediterraneibacter hominis]MBC5688513.1 hypothetical protein [Mediterraneibacter hominis]